jgi:hypothetical protein
MPENKKAERQSITKINQEPKKQKNDKIKLKYILTSKRCYLNRTFPSDNPEQNIIELPADMAKQFLRMKIGRGRVWESYKEPKKRIREGD